MIIFVLLVLASPPRADHAFYNRFHCEYFARHNLPHDSQWRCNRAHLRLTFEHDGRAE